MKKGSTPKTPGAEVQPGTCTTVAAAVAFQGTAGSGADRRRSFVAGLAGGGSVLDLDLALDTPESAGEAERFAVVASLEALEHGADHMALLDLAAARMAGDGLFVVCAPAGDPADISAAAAPRRCFTAGHFRLILEDRFGQVSYHHQDDAGCGSQPDGQVGEGLTDGAGRWLAVCRQPKPSRKRPRASIVIPLFNKFKFTLKALQAIAENTPDDFTYEVILVDNASSDETARALRHVSGDVLVLRNEVNLGFAKASNQGALLARGEYVVFLNNDTEVRPGWLQALTEELESHPDTGVAGGRLLYPDGTIQHAGVAIGRDLVPYHVHRQLPADHPLVMERRAFPVVTAACAAVRRTEFHSLGMFDEAFVNGHEDIDLCLRYRKRGQAAMYRPDCVAVHHESVSEGRMDSQPQNLARTLRKWRYDLVQDDFRYAVTEASRGQAVTPLRFALKIGPPDRSQRNWGDVYFAECLAKSLVRLGHACRIDYLNEWGRDDLDIDVVIHLKGLSEYHPKPYNVNILWMLNHPTLHTREELERYDAVLVASGPHAKRLQGLLPVPVYKLLQATDAEHFKPQAEQKKYDLVFVGNNKGVGRLDMRRIIADLLPTRHSLAVWGDGWAGLLPGGVLKGRFVPWEKLPQIYAQGRIVLNDHQPEMRDFGFINNRTYDAIAAGALVLSDSVRGMEEEFPVPFYNTRADLQRTVKALLKGGAKVEKKRAQLRDKVLAAFTFDRRAQELQGIIAKTRTDAVQARVAAARERAHSYRTVEKPLVSVLMSTHNRRDLLPAAMASVQAQTYPHWELVLVRDGGEPVDDLVAEAGDPRIRLIDLPESRGKGHAVNRAFTESRGEYLAYLDDDDIFYPQHLDTLLFALHNIPSIRMAVSNTEKVKLKEDEQGVFSEVGRELIYHRQITLGALLDKNQVTWLSVMHRRELFAEVGGLDEKLQAFLDHDLWRRMASRAYPYHVTALTAEYYLREYADPAARGQITRMSVADPPRYLANRLRVLGKPLVPETSPLHPVWERLRREARHEFLIARARKFKESGKMDRARRSFALAIRLRFDPIKTWRELGLTELEAGNPAEALAAFKQCLSQEGGQSETDYLHIALAYLELGRASAVLDCLAQLEMHFTVNPKVREIIIDYRSRAMRLLADAGAQAVGL